MEFNYYNVGDGACFIGFWPSTQQIALMSDHAVDGWAGFGYLNTRGGSLANSQCSVSLDGAQSSMQVISPTTIQVTLTITFLAGMPGPQQTWMQCGDNFGSPGWQQMGTWTTSVVNNANPSTGPEGTLSGSWSGAGDTFTFQASSANGWAYLTDFTAVLAPAGSQLYPATNSCRVDYSRLGNQIALDNDDGSVTNWIPLGTSQILQNGHCTLYVGQSSTQVVNGNTLQWNVALTFNSPWMGSAVTDYFYVFRPAEPRSDRVHLERMGGGGTVLHHGGGDDDHVESAGTNGAGGRGELHDAMHVPMVAEHAAYGVGASDDLDGGLAGDVRQLVGQWGGDAHDHGDGRERVVHGDVQQREVLPDDGGVTGEHGDGVAGQRMVQRGVAGGDYGHGGERSAVFEVLGDDEQFVKSTGSGDERANDGDGAVCAEDGSSDDLTTAPTAVRMAAGAGLSSDGVYGAAASGIHRDAAAGAGYVHLQRQRVGGGCERDANGERRRELDHRGYGGQHVVPGIIVLSE